MTSAAMSKVQLPPPSGPITDDVVPDMLAQLQTWVTLDQCKAHLRLLLHFSNLHQTYASRSELDYFAFLCTAERRYAAWMRGLATAIGRHHEVALVTNPPLPPLDVALFWAAHMLSPIRYMDDMSRVFPNVPEMHKVQFPIHALVAHADGGLVNTESERFWGRFISATEPYVLAAASFAQPLECPYCKASWTVTDAAAYVRFRVNGQILLCTHCSESVSVMPSSTARLLDDIVAFRANPTTHRLPASHIDPTTRLYDPQVNREQLVAMFVTKAKEWDALLDKYINLHAQPSNVKRATLSMDELLKPTKGPVAKTHRRAVKAIKSPTGNLYSRLIGSYQNIPVGPWSLDLVQAVLRQRDFTDKMANPSVQANANDFALRAQERYRKFLLLIRDHPDTFVVPTLDIDLGWHTHQLMGAKYVDFTQRLTGKVVNHDDAVGKGKLRGGVHETGLLWLKKFDEPYACDAKYHKFWTSDRIVPALLLPPLLGPIELYNASKHKQAINDAGGCAVHSPSSMPLQHSKAFSAFAKASFNSSPSNPATRSKNSNADPTKSSRLAHDAHPTPYLFFYSGCAPGGGSGACEFSEARVGLATGGSSGGDAAGCGTVGGSACGTGGCCADGGGCGSGGDGGGCGGGGGGCGGGGGD